MENEKLFNKSKRRILKLLKTGNPDAALEICEVLCNANPHYKNLELKVLCLYSCGRKKIALDLNLDLIKKFSKKHSLWNILGLIHSSMKNKEMAISCFEQAFKLKENANYISNLALEIKKKNIVESLELMEKHYNKFKNNYLFLFNLGTIIFELGDFSKAKKYYLESISAKNNFAKSHFNLSYCYFLEQDYEKGWKEYEWRWKEFKEYAWKKERFSNKKLWKGQPLTGKKILLYSEQGAGDTIQFARYIKKLEGEITLEIPKDLHRIFQSFNCKIVEDASKEKFDYHCSLISLAGILNTISGKPYIDWECSKWDKYNDKLKVGICWAGNPQHQNDKYRSCYLSNFNFKNVRLFSLQKDTRKRRYEDKIVDFCDSFSEEELIDLKHLLNDYGNLASAIQNMDLIITVDTSLAHLAGALGKKCLLLLPKNCDWRWGRTGNTTKWYDSLILFRQEELGNWKPVFEQVSNFISSYSEEQSI